VVESKTRLERYASFIISEVVARRFAPVGPHGLPVATIGHWLSESEFLLDLDTVANINHFVLNIRFDGDRCMSE
jgi:hypothetical protein